MTDDNSSRQGRSDAEKVDRKASLIALGARRLSELSAARHDSRATGNQPAQGPSIATSVQDSDRDVRSESNVSERLVASTNRTDRK